MNEHASDSDPLKLVLSFPLDDLQIYLLQRPVEDSTTNNTTRAIVFSLTGDKRIKRKLI